MPATRQQQLLLLQLRRQRWRRQTAGWMLAQHLGPLVRLQSTRLLSGRTARAWRRWGAPPRHRRHCHHRRGRRAPPPPPAPPVVASLPPPRHLAAAQHGVCLPAAPSTRGTSRPRPSQSCPRPPWRLPGSLRNHFSVNHLPPLPIPLLLLLHPLRPPSLILLLLPLLLPITHSLPHPLSSSTPCSSSLYSHSLLTSLPPSPVKKVVPDHKVAGMRGVKQRHDALPITRACALHL